MGNKSGTGWGGSSAQKCEPPKLRLAAGAGVSGELLQSFFIQELSSS